MSADVEDNLLVDTPETRTILERAAQLARVENTENYDESETRAKLNAHGISDAEIARQIKTLKANTAENKTAVITTYSFLHGLQHLDNLQRSSPQFSCSTEAVVTIFRCAEICLYNIGVLSAKMLTNIQDGRISRAVSAARWRSAFQGVLYKLSLLLVEMNPGTADGSFLDIRDSYIYKGYKEKDRTLQTWLMSRWQENDSDIFTKDIDDPQRYVFFHEFVNTSDERVWTSILERVVLPGFVKKEGENAANFYERVVCSREIEAMLMAMETEADTDLMSFRVVHQVTEVVANCVNRRLCEVTHQLLCSERLEQALGTLVLCNRLLTIVDENIKLLMRVLTPHAYSAIRPNLGMVRGTSSVVLRKTMFNKTYPLLVKAFKLRITDFSTELAYDDSGVRARSKAILREETQDPPTYSGILKQLLLLHQHVRTWRDNHLQLPKTHLGMSPEPDRPTVSLSGSESAVNSAHELRKTHTVDPIIPLYEAAMGTTPPAIHDLLTPGGFDEYMAHGTARAVFEVYGDVQGRFNERCRKAGSDG